MAPSHRTAKISGDPSISRFSSSGPSALDQRVVSRKREYVSRRLRSDQRGFTLLELLVTIALAASLIGVAASTFTQVSNAELRVASNRLATAMRYCFGYAVSHGKYIRLVLDLEGDRYWAESSSEPIFLSPTKRLEGDDPTALTEEQIDRNERAKEEGLKLIKPASFSKEPVIKEIKLKRGVELTGVFTSNQEDVFRTGRAYIHFFPHGFAEPALVYVSQTQSDDESPSYTLVLQPITGKVNRVFGEIEPDRYFGTPSKEEEEDGR